MSLENVMSNTKEEKEFLKKYTSERYEKPSLAADIVAFCVRSENVDNYRKLPELKLKVLLIKRKNHPYKDCWAVPGGFANKGETVLQSAQRELEEETNIRNGYLKLFNEYSTPGRDPRGWVVSNAFLAVVDYEKINVIAGDDAKEAKWFDINLKINTIEKTVTNEQALLKEEYIMNLNDVQEREDITIKVQRQVQISKGEEKSLYTITDSSNLAFDHGLVLLEGYLELRKNMKENESFAFKFLPETFTLTQLQKVFEVVLDETFLTPNFRRKIAKHIVDTGKMKSAIGHRPARIFSRNLSNCFE